MENEEISHNKLQAVQEVRLSWHLIPCDQDQADQDTSFRPDCPVDSQSIILTHCREVVVGHKILFMLQYTGDESKDFSDPNIQSSNAYPFSGEI